MSRNYFPAFGALTLLLGPILFVFTYDHAPTLTQSLRVVILLSAVEMVGFGLVRFRKWAAIYFSVPLFCYGIHKASISIYEIPFPFNLRAMLYGLSFTFPLLVTIRLWRQLTWGRRFF